MQGKQTEGYTQESNQQKRTLSPGRYKEDTQNNEIINTQETKTQTKSRTEETTKRQPPNTHRTRKTSSSTGHERKGVL